MRHCIGAHARLVRGAINELSAVGACGHRISRSASARTQTRYYAKLSVGRGPACPWAPLLRAPRAVPDWPFWLKLWRLVAGGVVAGGWWLVVVALPRLPLAWYWYRLQCCLWRCTKLDGTGGPRVDCVRCSSYFYYNNTCNSLARSRWWRGPTSTSSRERDISFLNKTPADERFQRGVKERCTASDSAL